MREQRTDFDRNTKWIWGSGRSPEETNQYQAFRKSFTFQGGGSTELKITADSRYVLYLNGERLGQGPVRSWPFDQKYDRYDLTSRLRPGQNTVAILVQYLGVSTFQYIAGRGEDSLRDRTRRGGRIYHPGGQRSDLADEDAPCVSLERASHVLSNGLRRTL